MGEHCLVTATLSMFYMTTRMFRSHDTMHMSQCNMEFHTANMNQFSLASSEEDTEINSSFPQTEAGTIVLVLKRAT